MWALALFTIYSTRYPEVPIVSRPVVLPARTHLPFTTTLLSHHPLSGSSQHTVPAAVIYLMYKTSDRMFVIVHKCLSRGPGASPLALAFVVASLTELSTLNIPLVPPCRLHDDQVCRTCVTGLARALSAARVPRHIPSRRV